MTAASLHTVDPDDQLVRQYESQRTDSLRLRAMLFCTVYGGLLLLHVLFILVGQVVSEHDPYLPQHPRIYCMLRMLPPALLMGVYAGALIWLRRCRPTNQRILTAVFWLLIVSGLCMVLFAPFFDRGAVQAAADGRQAVAIYEPAWGLVHIGLVHVLAAAFIPLTLGETIRPLLLLLAMHAMMVLGFADGAMGHRLLVLAASPLVGLPGILIFAGRYHQFAQDASIKRLSGQVGLMERELLSARRIHDGLFPSPIQLDGLRFDYRYLPMKQIGGDYLYAYPEHSLNGEPRRLAVVLLDVTGHGIGAALTVNRIHGELERLFGERTDLAPGETIHALNHYFAVALAKYNVYGTAICVRVDPKAGIVEWANAGHPPAMLQRAAGGIDRLDPTAPMLGVFGTDEFDAEPRSMSFDKGDTLIAYTDGVTEARNPEGAMLRVQGMQKIIETIKPIRLAAGGYADAIIREVSSRKYSTEQDDTLIVEISRGR